MTHRRFALKNGLTNSKHLTVWVVLLIFPFRCAHCFFFIPTKMKSFSRIRFFSFLTVFAIELFQFVAHAQDAEFVSFKSFDFPKENNENSSDSQFFAFAIAINKSAPLNVSLNAENSSGVVLSAKLCDNSRQKVPSDWPTPANTILALTANSDQFKSVLLRTDALSFSDQCPLTNHSVADQSVLLLFEVHSMIKGSHGTLAVRRTDVAEGAMAFTAEGVPNELVEENAEWLLKKGRQPLVLPILGNCSAGDCSNLVQYSAHIAIRQGLSEIALVQDCPSLLMDNNNNSGLAQAENRTILLLDNFQLGEYLRLLNIHFGENGTANGTIQRGNHSEQSMELRHCLQSAENNESSSSYGNINLFISSSSSQPSIVAISQLRIFNARHLTPAAEGPSSVSIGHFVLFVLLSVALFFLFGFFAFFLFRHFLPAHCEKEKRQKKKEDGHFEMDQMGSEHSTRPPSTVSKREEKGPKEMKINAKALEERAIGGANGGGWM